MPQCNVNLIHTHTHLYLYFSGDRPFISTGFNPNNDNRNPYAALTLIMNNQMKYKTFELFSFSIAGTDFLLNLISSCGDQQYVHR